MPAVEGSRVPGDLRHTLEGSDLEQTSAPLPVWRLTSGGSTRPIVTGHEQVPTVPHPQNDIVVRRRKLLRGGFWAGVSVLTFGGLAAATDFLAPRGVRFLNAATVPAGKVPKRGGGISD